MESGNPANLAEKIARLIASESQGSVLSSIQNSLDQINHRLEKLETASAAAQSIFLSPRPLHPSQDRFEIAEAIVDSLFDAEAKEKACTYEPSKPCDHCSMCSSRGF